MEVIIKKDCKQLSEAVANEVIALVKLKPEAILCFPSGDTPLGLFKLLVEYQSNQMIDLLTCTYIGLDEWTGMDETDEGSCKYIIYHELFNPLGLRREQIHFFNAKARDLKAECNRIDSVIESVGGIDLMILGVGMNGHLGLNEPRVDETLYSHEVSLDLVTQEVGQRYFRKPTSLRSGITLGVQHIMQSRRVIAMVTGKHKAAITKLVLEGEISNRIPASLLRNHVNAVLYLDQDATEFLNTEQ
jgi:glucosamine-6-phosphate isomerase